jgi:hypothetical protein
VTVTVDLLRRLAVYEPDSPVLSVHLRTDPRDPANTARTPGWLVALRNGQREVLRAVEARGTREERLAVRDLLEQVETGILTEDPDERGRGVAWFVTADGSLDERLTLQVPPREHVLRWDARPFVSPLVDVADRGRPAGVVLISTEAMRLLHWEGGRIEEPERSLYEFDRGEWRDYAAYAMANPGSAGIHVDTLEHRIEEWRRRFLRDAARTLAARLDELEWKRLLLAGDSRATADFAAALPNPLRERIVAEVDANLLWEQPPALAERLEGELEAAWARDVRTVAEQALAAAQAGGLGATGWPEVLSSVLEHRVRHVVFAHGAAPPPGRVPPGALEALGSPDDEFLVERIVEHAVAADADVSVLRPEDSDLLASADGIAATLRY